VEDYRNLNSQIQDKHIGHLVVVGDDQLGTELACNVAAMGISFVDQYFSFT
jgi:hypothetical protein